jgi:hypothetical protein
MLVARYRSFTRWRLRNGRMLGPIGLASKVIKMYGCQRKWNGLSLTQYIDHENAFCSSLWELDALQQHYSPTVAKFSDVFFNVFQKKEYDIDEFLGQDYGSVRDCNQSFDSEPFSHILSTSFACSFCLRARFIMAFVSLLAGRIVSRNGFAACDVLRLVML